LLRSQEVLFTRALLSKPLLQTPWISVPSLRVVPSLVSPPYCLLLMGLRTPIISALSFGLPKRWGPMVLCCHNDGVQA
jgi:hypothetical protein